MYPKLARNPELQPGSIALVAVGYGSTGVEGFMESASWQGGPLFIDPEVKPKPKMFAHFATKSKGAVGLFSPKVISAVWKGKAKTDASKAGGNQWNLGGTFVVDARDGSIVFEHRQKGFADHPDVDAMLAACAAALGPPAPASDDKAAASSAAASPAAAVSSAASAGSNEAASTGSNDDAASS